MAGQNLHGGTDPPNVEGQHVRRGRRHSPDEPRVWEQDGAATTGRVVDAEPLLVTVPEPDEGVDWMDRARREAESQAWSPGESLEELDLELATAPSLVRPYTRTGGRTKPVRDLDLEALVHTTVSGKEASTGPWLNPEHTTIIEMCSGTVSVAEIAARLKVPIGVARVIIADMVDLGLVEVMKTSAADGDERDPAFLRRVLSGLQRL
jgi:hypothetical protein